MSLVEAHLLCELAEVGDAPVLEQLRQEGDDDHLGRVRARVRGRVRGRASRVLEQLRQEGASMMITPMGCGRTY
jgi:hypothetical protein